MVHHQGALFHRPSVAQRCDGDVPIVRYVDHPDHLWDRTFISIRDGAIRQHEDNCPLIAPTHRLARPAKRGLSVHDPQGRGVNAAPGALAGLFAAQRVYQTMSQGSVYPRPEDPLESREPYVVQLGGPNPCVSKVQMVLVTLLELNGPLPRLMAPEPRVQKVILTIRDGLHRPDSTQMSLPLKV